MRTQKETDLEDRVAKLESGNYVCPCPDGCNGCEVPDFALKEIEELKARAEALEETLIEVLVDNGRTRDEAQHIADLAGG